MLRSTFYSFTTALRGLSTAQKQLDVTGQNISNASTTGYTRQRADTYASSAAGYGDKYTSVVNYSLAGQGSVVSGISQIRDPFLDVRFRREASALGEEDAKLSCMKDMELIFDEIESSGLRKSFDNFVSKLQSLANNAESSEFDSIARDAASTLVNQFKQYSSQLSTVREQQEYQLKEVTVNTVNDLLKNLANLNDSIRTQEVSGGSALELNDQRNLLLDELSTYVKLDVDYDPTVLSNGATVNDIYVKMLGEDGSTTDLIYNNAYAKLTATLPGEITPLGITAAEAIVTIDNSDLQAKTILDEVNKAISNVSTINKKLSTLFTAQATDTDSYTTALSDAETALATTQVAYDAETDAVAKATLGQTIKGLKTKIEDFNTIGKLLASRGTNEATISTAFGANVTINNSTDSNLDGNIDIADYSIILTNTDSTTTSLVSTTSGTKLTKADLLKAGQIFTSTTANTLQSTGSLKGVLDMLNSNGTFDDDNNQIRGIGYYENMLGSLVNQVASNLNLMNSIYTTSGGINIVTDSRPLFETSDGSTTFTASNLKIADGWAKGSYGITASKKQTTDGSSGASENILLMISACSAKQDYTTDGGTFLYNGTFQEFLSNIGNVLSLDVSSTSNLLENHTTVLEDIQDSKDSISSVSLDEEGINLMQYQKAYNAAARLMTTLDEAIETIINKMGMVGR